MPSHFLEVASCTYFHICLIKICQCAEDACLTRATLGPRLQAAAVAQSAMETELKGAPLLHQMLRCCGAAQRCAREAVQLLAAALHMDSAGDADPLQTR